MLIKMYPNGKNIKLPIRYVIVLYKLVIDLTRSRVFYLLYSTFYAHDTTYLILGVIYDVFDNLVVS